MTTGEVIRSSPTKPRTPRTTRSGLRRRVRMVWGSMLLLVGLVVVPALATGLAVNPRDDTDLGTLLLAARPRGYELSAQRTGVVDEAALKRWGTSVSAADLRGARPFAVTWEHSVRPAVMTVLGLDLGSNFKARDAVRGTAAAFADARSLTFDTGLDGASGHLLTRSDGAGSRLSGAAVVFRQGTLVVTVVAWSRDPSVPLRRDATRLAAELQRRLPAGPHERAESTADQAGYQAATVVLGFLFYVLALEGAAIVGERRARRRPLQGGRDGLAAPVVLPRERVAGAPMAAAVRDLDDVVRRRRRIARNALAAKLLAAVLVAPGLYRQAWPVAAIPVVLGLLVAVVAYRAERRALRRTAVGASRPPRQRRLWTGKHTPRVAAFTFLSLVLALNGLVLLLTASVAANPAASHLAAGTSLLASVFAYRRARRHAALGAAEVRRRDTRPGLLYLRSFADDGTKVRARRSARQSWLERVGAPRRERFEEVVAWQLSRLGPVVAVSEPGESFAPLGAAREELADESWQDEIETRMLRARAIAIVVGRTTGLAWEAAKLTELGLWSKTFVILPPVARDDLRARWDDFRSLVERAGGGAWELPAGPDRVLVVVADAEGDRLTAYAGPGRDEWSYEAALGAAADQLAGG